MRHITFIRIGFLALCACILALVMHSTPVYTVYEDPHLQSLQTQGKWERIRLEYPIEFGTKPAPDAAVVAEEFWIPREYIIAFLEEAAAALPETEESSPSTSIFLQRFMADNLSYTCSVYCAAVKQGIQLDPETLGEQVGLMPYDEEERTAYLDGAQMTETEYVESAQRDCMMWLTSRVLVEQWIAEERDSDISNGTFEKKKSACMEKQHIQIHITDTE